MNKDIKDFYEKTVMDFSQHYGEDPDFQAPENWVRIFFKTYPRFPKKEVLASGEGEFIGLLKRRISRRDHVDEPISREQLDALIYYSMGIKNPEERQELTKRFYPSGGARFPVEGYYISNNTSGIERGLYHYNSKQNCWEFIWEKDLRGDSGEIFGIDITKGNPNFLVLTGVTSRSEVKYGIHAYRFALLEAGHIGQNILLNSERLGLGSCPIGGFDNRRLESLLDLGEDEIPLYAISIGKVKEF